MVVIVSLLLVNALIRYVCFVRSIQSVGGNGQRANRKWVQGLCYKNDIQIPT